MKKTLFLMLLAFSTLIYSCTKNNTPNPNHIQYAYGTFGNFSSGGGLGYNCCSLYVNNDLAVDCVIADTTGYGPIHYDCSTLNPIRLKFVGSPNRTFPSNPYLKVMFYTASSTTDTVDIPLRDTIINGVTTKTGDATVQNN